MSGPLSVPPLMDEIEAGVRSRLRSRLVERGVTAYDDRELFERVRAVLQRGGDRASALRGPLPPGSLDALLLPELLSDEEEWTLEPNLRLSSHRRLLGPVILFAKRRLLLPLTRWLFEYTQTNFRRQQYFNRILIACVEELAIENARLRRDLEARPGMTSRQ
jgi:hypothetical protein